MEPPKIKVRPEYMKPLETEDFTFSPIGDCEQTEIDKQNSRQRLGETELKKKEGLRKLKEKFAKDKEIQYRTDDQNLLGYLRYAKFNYNKAYNAIHKLYSMRHNYPEFFNLTPKLEYLLKSGVICYLPYKDEEGRVLSWFNFRKWNLEEISLCEVMQTFNAVADMMCVNPSIQINGLVTVWDFRGLTMKHMMPVLYPRALHLVFTTFQEIYPSRPKLIIGIYCNSLIRAAYRIIRPVLKKKIADRVKFLGSDMTELYQYVNPSILPKDYGGSLDEDRCNTAQFILDNLPYLEYERSFGFTKSCAQN